MALVALLGAALATPSLATAQQTRSSLQSLTNTTVTTNGAFANTGAGVRALVNAVLVSVPTLQDNNTFTGTQIYQGNYGSSMNSDGSIVDIRNDPSVSAFGIYGAFAFVGGTGGPYQGYFWNGIRVSGTITSSSAVYGLQEYAAFGTNLSPHSTGPWTGQPVNINDLVNYFGLAVNGTTGAFSWNINTACADHLTPTGTAYASTCVAYEIDLNPFFQMVCSPGCVGTTMNGIALIMGGSAQPVGAVAIAIGSNNCPGGASVNCTALGGGWTVGINIPAGSLAPPGSAINIGAIYTGLYLTSNSIATGSQSGVINMGLLDTSVNAHNIALQAVPTGTNSSYTILDTWINGPTLFVAGYFMTITPGNMSISLSSYSVTAGVTTQGNANFNLLAKGTGTITLQSVVQQSPFTFATKACGGSSAGALEYITDANSVTNGSSVTSGGGSTKVLLWCNGTNWIAIVH